MSLRHRELVILRTTALCGADYEWGVHVAFFAAKAGFDATQIRSLATGSANDSCWKDPADVAALMAVNMLHADNDLTEDTWLSLVASVGGEAALELTLLAGWYHAISFAVRALRLPLEPDTHPIPS